MVNNSVLFVENYYNCPIAFAYGEYCHAEQYGGPVFPERSFASLVAGLKSVRLA